VFERGGEESGFWWGVALRVEGGGETATVPRKRKEGSAAGDCSLVERICWTFRVVSLLGKSGCFRTKKEGSQHSSNLKKKRKKVIIERKGTVLFMPERGRGEPSTLAVGMSTNRGRCDGGHSSDRGRKRPRFPLKERGELYHGRGLPVQSFAENAERGFPIKNGEGVLVAVPSIAGRGGGRAP